MTEDTLINWSIKDLIDQLNQLGWFHDGRIDLFRNLCKKMPDKAVKVLQQLKNIESFEKIWHAALVGLVDADNQKWDEVALILQDLNSNLYKKEARAIVQWVENASKNISYNSNSENYFWSISEELFNSINDDSDGIDKRDIISDAINHPIGILTQAFLWRLANRNLKAQERITDINCLNFSTKVLSNKTNKFILGRVLLASRLSYFYLVDPDWTKYNLLPLFQWNSPNESLLIWQGYLWLASISLELAIELKTSLLDALKNDDKFSDNDKKNYTLFLPMFVLSILMCILMRKNVEYCGQLEKMG